MSTSIAFDGGYQWRRFCACCKRVAGKEVVLRKCAGCQTSQYCSRECQKSAWSTHRDTCKAIQKYPSDSMATTDKLFNFAKAHTPNIKRGALRALELWRDPSRGLRDIFVVYLRSNHNSSCLRTAFVVTNATVISANGIGPESDKYLKLLADKNNIAKSVGLMGGFLVWFLLEDAEKKSYHRISIPISFGNDIFLPDTSALPWLVQLKSAINDGVTSL